MMVGNTDEKRDYGLLPDEEQHLALHLLREGKWPREVTIERTGTVYRINNKRQAQRLLTTMGIECRNGERTSGR